MDRFASFEAFVTVNLWSVWIKRLSHSAALQTHPPFFQHGQLIAIKDCALSLVNESW